MIVTPKPVVNDPQGITVRQGLATLGFGEVSDVRVGKYIEVSLDAASEHEARQRVEAMCKQLLANHVIEDYRFEIEADGRVTSIPRVSPDGRSDLKFGVVVFPGTWSDRDCGWVDRPGARRASSSTCGTRTRT